MQRQKICFWFALVCFWTLALPAVRAEADIPLGATVDGNGTTFRVWAPFAEVVAVKVNNQIIQMQREPSTGNGADAVYSVNVPGGAKGAQYRYVIGGQGTTGEYIDPRSRQLTSPTAGAFSIVTDNSPSTDNFKCPNFNEMVIYELHVGTFTGTPGGAEGTFKQLAAKLDYLKDLGVNAIELLPVHENAPGPGHTPANHDWGYDPAQLFAVKGSYGSVDDFKDLIKQAHQHGIAVIVDVVYNHLAPSNLLDHFGGFTLQTVPKGVYFYGDNRVDTGFGPRPDYGRPQVRSYIQDNALMYLREMGADGLRWDSTINIRAFENGAKPIPDGSKLMRDANDAYRNSDPKQPWKITIAEDLQSSQDIDKSVAEGGLGFNGQWEESLFYALRKAVFAVNDNERDLFGIRDGINKTVGADVFNRVIFSENHDKVGHPGDQADGKPQIRLPRLIDENNPVSIFAKKRSTLAAAVVLTAPGIPMLFQGQEMLDTETFTFEKAQNIDWTRIETFKGIVQLYRDLIAVRRNTARKTTGLTRQNCNVFHVNSADQTLAYHRYGDGGHGDDVVIVANFSNVPKNALNIGFPREGKWSIRFNSGASMYDKDYKDGDSADVTAVPGNKDNLNFNGNIVIGAYSLIVLSQD